MVSRRHMSPTSVPSPGGRAPSFRCPYAYELLCRVFVGSWVYPMSILSMAVLTSCGISLHLRSPSRSSPSFTQLPNADNCMSEYQSFCYPSHRVRQEFHLSNQRKVQSISCNGPACFIAHFCAGCQATERTSSAYWMSGSVLLGVMDASIAPTTDCRSP